MSRYLPRTEPFSSFDELLHFLCIPTIVPNKKEHFLYRDNSNKINVINRPLIGASEN